ncbi:hypothetical protein JW964_14585 [candidate division KSB1 bacterium]|nr:hypothetical protein [candidate division KSB1 bacterium]
MFTYQQIYRAYLKCRENKRNKPAALNFELNQEELIFNLVDSLNARSYRPTTSTCFYVNQPKPREIFAADFRDRIVHHLVYSRLVDSWEKRFIAQSFACRPEKGTHHAAQQLQTYLRKITRNGKVKAWYLKLDLHNFFMSINKKILFDILIRHCPDAEIRWLLEVIIFHNPTTDYEKRGPQYLQQQVPPHKSLFNVAENYGLPIGNLTSQFFANVYLNELDYFVKHVLKCLYYLRYVDDFILLAESLGELKIWYQEIIHFLDTRLELKLNHHATRLDSIFNGVDFVGYIVRPHYILCRRRVIHNLKQRLIQFQQKHVTFLLTKIIWNYEFDPLEKLLAQFNSYLGHFRHARTRKVILKIYELFPFIKHYFYPGFRRLVRKYRPKKHIQTLKAQVVFFTRLFPNALRLYQIGCYYETFGHQAQKLHELLGYQLKTNWRNFSCASGFHQRHLERVCELLEEKQVEYLVIRQTGKYLIYTMERMPYKHVEFSK